MGYLVVILMYIAFLVIFGLVLTKKKVSSSDDFAVAGRNLPFLVLVGTLLATWCGGGGITGSANFIYTNGPFAGILHFLGPPLGIIVLYWVSGKVRESNTYTIPELFEQKYGATGRIIATFGIVLAYMGIVSSQFIAAGRVISLTTGINQDLATILSAVGIILLTVTGGLVTVAYTDALSAIIMVGGFLIASFVLLGKVDLPGGVLANLPAGKNTITGSLNWIQMLGYIFPSFFLILGDQNMMQRFSAAKDVKEAKKSNIGMFFGELAVIITTLMIVTAGIFLIPDAEAPDTIIFQLAMQFLPFIFGALLISACIAFVITTGDSFLLSASTNLTYDVWVRFLKKDATDKQKLLCMRLLVAVLGVISYVIGRFFPSILAIQMTSYTMYGAAITPALLCALFYKKVTKAGGVAGMLAGGLTTIVWDMFLKKPAGINSVLIAVPIAFIVIFAVSQFTQPKKGSTIATA